MKFIRKITVEYTETLEPSESSTSDEEDFMIFEAFRNNFLYPLTPKTKVKVGQGIGSTLGKIIDEYFAKIIIVEFMLSLWGFVAEVPGLNIPDYVSTIVNISSIALIGVIFLMMVIKMRTGQPSDLDVDELDQKMRKRRRRKFRR